MSTTVYSENVLDKDKLWSELTQVNKDFLFGCGSRYGQHLDTNDEEGFVRGHAYTVLEAREVKHKGEDLRMLKIKCAQKSAVVILERHADLERRNPWGRQEWNGAWSDGSKEWTADMMRELDHTFGDDGVRVLTPQTGFQLH